MSVLDQKKKKKKLNLLKSTYLSDIRPLSKTPYVPMKYKVEKVLFLVALLQTNFH